MNLTETQKQDLALAFKHDCDHLNSLEFQRSQMKIAVGALKITGVNCISINQENLIACGTITEDLVKFFMSEIARLDEEIAKTISAATAKQTFLLPK